MQLAKHVVALVVVMLGSVVLAQSATSTFMAVLASATFTSEAMRIRVKKNSVVSRNRAAKLTMQSDSRESVGNKRAARARGPANDENRTLLEMPTPGTEIPCKGFQVQIVRQLTSGTNEAVTFEVLALPGRTSALLKIPKERPPSQQQAVKEAIMIKHMLDRGVNPSYISQCMGACDWHGKPSLVITPLLRRFEEFGQSGGDLGSRDRNIHAATRAIQTMMQMLSAGIVNVDQANNILYHEVGDNPEPLFIDFSQCIDLSVCINLPGAAMRKPSKDIEWTPASPKIQFDTGRLKLFVKYMLDSFPAVHPATLLDIFDNSVKDYFNPHAVFGLAPLEKAEKFKMTTVTAAKYIEDIVTPVLQEAKKRLEASAERAAERADRQGKTQGIGDAQIK